MAFLPPLLLALLWRPGVLLISCPEALRGWLLMGHRGQGQDRQSDWHVIASAVRGGGSGAAWLEW